eukprot:6181840-Pleurochrysis_carterae.AAC.5
MWQITSIACCSIRTRARGGAHARTERTARPGSTPAWRCSARARPRVGTRHGRGVHSAGAALLRVLRCASRILLLAQAGSAEPPCVRCALCDAGRIRTTRT